MIKGISIKEYALNYTRIPLKVYQLRDIGVSGS